MPESVVQKAAGSTPLTLLLASRDAGNNGKENGNYYIIIGYVLGFYRDDGKENGNYNTIKGERDIYIYV